MLIVWAIIMPWAMIMLWAMIIVWAMAQSMSYAFSMIKKRRSTAVDVAGAVKYLNMSFNATIRTIFCGYQDKPKLYLFANATRATPAGPFASKEASIFSHQARHSTSCSSENRTLSTKSSTDLVPSYQLQLSTREHFRFCCSLMIFYFQKNLPHSMIIAHGMIIAHTMSIAHSMI